MATKKSKRLIEKGITGIGVAVFPFVNQPSTKFNPDGEYNTRLRLGGPEAEKLIAQIDDFTERAYRAELLYHGKKSLKRSEFLPYKPATDDEGNEIPGEFVFSFKKKAITRSKDGQEFRHTVMLVDAKKGAFPRSTLIFGGSKIRVGFALVPWFTPAFGFGVRLQLDVVQVIDLVTKGGVSLDDYGFEEEDGFVAEAADETPSDEGSDDDVESGADF